MNFKTNNSIQIKHMCYLCYVLMCVYGVCSRNKLIRIRIRIVSRSFSDPVKQI